MELVGLFSAAAPAATTVLGNTALTSAATTALGATVPTATAGLSWGSILSGISAGASLLKGFSGYQSGNINAAYQQDAANQALAAGAANKDIADARGRAQLAELRAQTGAQGTTASGSPLLVYLDSVKNAAIESQNEYYQGSLKSSGLRAQAKISKMGATSSLWEGIAGVAGAFAPSIGSRLLA